MKHNIGSVLAKRAHLSPKLEAFVDVSSGRRFNYAEFNDRANQTAHALTAQGVAKGDRVALLMMNSIEFMESFFAIAKLGAICVPLNWRLVPDELAFILKDSGSSTLIYDDDFAKPVAELHSRGPDATRLERWICLGSSRAEFALDYGTIQGAAPTDEPAVVAWDDDELYIMYTSGTTGLPKGVIHTHDTALWASLTIGITAEMRYRDRYLVCLPLFHVGALTPITGNVHRGLTNVVVRSFDPAQTWELIEKEKIDNMLAVPAMLNFMLQVTQKDEVDFSTLRWRMSGAAPVPVSLIEAYNAIGIEIHQVYGLTETCGPACLINPEDAIARAGSTGKAFFHTEVRVVDAQGRDVQPGEVGEVAIAGRHIMKGYWNRPEETAETIRDGWLYSGDLAMIDKEGFIFIQDRKKDMIISGGENVYPAEIENVILSHPGVSEVAVIGQPSARWGETPLAVVVKSDPSLTAQDVLDHTNGKLARFKQPRGVEFVDVIPRNPTGKVLKRELREQFPRAAPE
ncbi:MAG: long-chain fatty acid--CoA ligase [Myxococcota bacterium]